MHLPTRLYVYEKSGLARKLRWFGVNVNSRLFFLHRLFYRSKWDQFAGQGGIWQNDPISLTDMQNRSTQKLERKKAEILENLSVNIDTLNRNNGDLEVPINSGSLARLLVSSFPSEIPVDITAQAKYWVTLIIFTNETIDFSILTIIKTINLIITHFWIVVMQEIQRMVVVC